MLFLQAGFLLTKALQGVPIARVLNTAFLIYLNCPT